MAYPYHRIYARWSTFSLECPKCRRLIFISPKGRHHKAYDKFKGFLRCPHCTSCFYLGMLVWEAPPGPPVAPPDVKPTYRQLEDYHAETGALWVNVAYRKGTPVNRAIDAPCCCPPLPWRKECPVHGELEGPRQPLEESDDYDSVRLHGRGIERRPGKMKPKEKP